jgi:hypothetical protein
MAQRYSATVPQTLRSPLRALCPNRVTRCAKKTICNVYRVNSPHVCAVHRMARAACRARTGWDAVPVQRFGSLAHASGFARPPPLASASARSRRPVSGLALPRTSVGIGGMGAVLRKFPTTNPPRKDDKIVTLHGPCAVVESRQPPYHNHFLTSTLALYLVGSYAASLVLLTTSTRHTA